MKCVVCYEKCDNRGRGPSGRSRGQTTAKIILHLFEHQLTTTSTPIRPSSSKSKYYFNCCPKCFTDLIKIDRIYGEIEALHVQLAKAKEQIGTIILTSFMRCQSQNVNLDLDHDNSITSTNSIRQQIVKALKPDINDVKKEIVDDNDDPAVDDKFDDHKIDDILNNFDEVEVPDMEVSSFDNLGDLRHSLSTNSEAEDKITFKVEVDQLKSAEESDQFSKSNQDEEQDIDDDDVDNDNGEDYEAPTKKAKKKPISYEKKKQLVQFSLKHPNWRARTLGSKLSLKSLTSSQLCNWKKLVEKTEDKLAQTQNTDDDSRFFEPHVTLAATLPPAKRKRDYDHENSKEVFEIDYEFLRKECLQKSILTLTPVPYEDVLNSTSINENAIKKYIQNDAQKLRENRILKRKRNAAKSNLIFVKKSQEISCPYCPYSTSSSTKYYNLKKHILNLHPETDEAKTSIYMCTVCQSPKKFSNESQLDLHNRKFHSDQPYFEPKPRIIQSDDDNVKKFLCVLCNKNFATLQCFRSHCRVIHNKVMKTCTHCNKSIPKHRLLAHIASNHPPESEKNSHCPTCSKVFPSLWKLKKHQEYHKTKLLCRFCEKIFSNHANLRDHELRHEGKFDYVCELCSKPFISMDGLRSHMKIVHGEKKPCPHCAKSINEHNLEFHIKQFHEKAFNFYCHVCSSGFVRVRELNQHLKKHSKKVEKQNISSKV